MTHFTHADHRDVQSIRTQMADLAAGLATRLQGDESHGTPEEIAGAVRRMAHDLAIEMFDLLVDAAEMALDTWLANQATDEQDGQ